MLLLGHSMPNQQKIPIFMKFGIECQKACLTGEICTLHIEAKDMPSSNLLQHFKACIDYIEGARKAGSIACMEWLAKTTTIVAAYLMKSEKLSRGAALQSIVAIKSSVKPNFGFLEHLEIWEDMRWCIGPQHKLFKSYMNRSWLFKQGVKL